jgi:hypothetical protein
MTGRTKVQDLAQGRESGGIAVPLALATAARIQERDWADFLEDPTQLANGLRDLHQAVSPDGLAVTQVDVLVEQSSVGLGAGPHAVAAVEAVRRLRTSLGDLAALVAPVPGPARLASSGVGEAEAAEQVQAFGRELLGAGADVILIIDDVLHGSLSTLGNIARFHRGVVAFVGEGTGQIVSAQVQSLGSPEAATGLVVTDGDVPRDTDITIIEDWVETVQGG